MGLTLLRLSLLISIGIALAFCVSATDNDVQRSPRMAAHAMRPPIRFIGSDSLPAKQKASVHAMVEKPLLHGSEPISQDMALNMIRAILAQHDLYTQTEQEHSDPVGRSTTIDHDIGSTVPKEPVHSQASSVGFIANYPSDQQSVLHSFVENQTVTGSAGSAQKLVGVSEVDFPCFGDGYCCCEGCPPGSCPSMFVSVDTGARLPGPLGNNTVTCPCAVPFEYCCCAGCPRGTCIAGSC